MIRVGLPLPLLARLRQQWNTIRNRYLRQSYIVRNWWSERLDTKRTAHRARTLEQELHTFQAFSNAYHDLIDIVCMAAREEAPALYLARYQSQQRRYQRAYRAFSNHLRPYYKEWDLETDPFAFFCEGKLNEVIYSATGIETMMTLNGILEACQCHYEPSSH